MKALIFAAGLGTRLKPFTDFHPKALAPVGGRPNLANTIEAVKAAGIDESDIVVNIHHFPEQIRTFLADNYPGVITSDESTLLLDTGGGLLNALPLLGASAHEPTETLNTSITSKTSITSEITTNTALLINADIATDLPLADIIASHRSSGADVTLLCADRSSSRTLLFDSADRLCGWKNLTTGETRPIDFEPTQDMVASPFCGVHVVNVDSLAPLLKAYAVDAGEVFPIIPFYLSNLHHLDIRRFLLPPSAHWFDIGTPEKLHAANAHFLS